jgi:hypothetical protein
MKFLKYSGIWFGLVINPYHWRFAINQPEDALLQPLDGIEIFCGPVWMRVIIDDGSW